MFARERERERERERKRERERERGRENNLVCIVRLPTLKIRVKVLL